MFESLNPAVRSSSTLSSLSIAGADAVTQWVHYGGLPELSSVCRQGKQNHQQATLAPVLIKRWHGDNNVLAPVLIKRWHGDNNLLAPVLIKLCYGDNILPQLLVTLIRII